jgi:isoleucyl-tRNA synthetase
VTRYAAQTGHYVERKFGWDCHGLPIEYEIDKEYGLKTREDVLKVYFFTLFLLFSTYSITAWS